MALFAAAAPAFGGEGRWNYAATTSATNWPNAAAWADEANWTDGYPKAPSGAANTAAFTYGATGVRYVRLPDEGLTIGKLVLQKTPVVYFTGGKLTTKSIASSSTYPSTYYFFHDIDFTDKDNGYAGQYFCGRVSLPNGVSWTSGSLYSIPCHNFNRGAASEDWSENIVNPAPTNSMIAGSGGGKFFYAPRGTSSDLSCSCTLTPGSKIVLFGPKTAQNVLPVGTRVTGTGIPDGTYLQYIYSQSFIGLSKTPTVETVQTVTLTFKAYTPHVTQHMLSFQCNAGGPQRLQLNKYRKEDVFRLTLDRLVSQSGSTSDATSFRLDAAYHTYEPGTLVLKDTSNMNSRFYLGPYKCHIEFDPTGSRGLNAKCRTCLSDASTTARVTCPAGATYQIGCLTNFVGTLVKDGPATLAIGARDVANNALVIEAGEVVWTNTVAAASGPEDQYLTTLAISNGATFRVAGGAGLAVKKLVAEKGARIAGPGTLRLPGGASNLSDLGNVTFVENAMVEIPGGAGSVATDAAVGTGTVAVVGVPALWLDVTATNSFTFWDESARTVRRWADRRGSGYLFATNISGSASLAPEVVTNAAGQYSYLRIANAAYPTNPMMNKDTRGLVWSEVVKGVRAVFAVMDAHEGGGTILGGSARVTGSSASAAVRGSYCGPFSRGARNFADFSQPLVDASTAVAATTVIKGLFYQDGEQVDGTKQGFYDFGRHLIESHPIAPGCWADALGIWYVDRNIGNPDSNGRCRYQEIIVYTNELTYLERAKVADYLTRKWFGHPAYHTAVAESSVLPVTPADDGTASYVFTDGTSSGLSGLEGSFVKGGAGELVIDDVAPDASLSVTDGRVILRSSTPEDAWIPRDGLFFRFDAAQTNTYVMDGAKTIERINDAEGGTINGRTWGKRINILESGLNGHNVFDFGTLYSASGNADWSKGVSAVLYDGNTYFPYMTGPYACATFMVVGSQGGGNSLLGQSYNSHPGRGWVRYPDQNVTYTGTDKRKMPIFSYGSYWSFLRNFSTQNEYGNWISMDDSTACKTRMFRIDGAAADPWRTEMSGDYQIVSYNTDDFGTRLFSLASGGQTCAYLGGLRYGELIVYRQGVSRTQRDRIEAYLAKKWFDRDTAGYSPEAIGSLAVASGATVAVDGNAPLTASALAGAGTFEGSLTLAPHATVTVPVDGDGRISTELTVTGTLDVSNGGTVVLTGDTARLQVGFYRIVASSEPVKGARWTVSGYEGRKSLLVKVKSDGLWLEVVDTGFTIFFR